MLKTKAPQLKPTTVDECFKAITRDKKFLKKLRKQNKEIEKIVVQLKDKETSNDQDSPQIC